MYLFCINLAHVSDCGPFLYKKGILILCLFCAYFVPQKCAYFVLFFGMGGLARIFTIVVGGLWVGLSRCVGRPGPQWSWQWNPDWGAQSHSLASIFAYSFNGFQVGLHLRVVSPGSLLFQSVGFGPVCAFTRSHHGFCC